MPCTRLYACESVTDSRSRPKRRQDAVSQPDLRDAQAHGDGHGVDPNGQVQAVHNI